MLLHKGYLDDHPLPIKEGKFKRLIRMRIAMVRWFDSPTAREFDTFAQC